MRALSRRGRGWLGGIVAGLVGWALPWIIELSLRRGLRGVWLLGRVPELPAGSFIVAPNHHSWWDAYLVWLVSVRIDRPSIAIMGREQLERFPFFRRIGVLADDEVRTALGCLQRGKVLVLFPEGELRSKGATGPLHRGVSFFARASGVPVLPLALRVELRGAKRPEAYLAFGTALPPGGEMLPELAQALDGLLESIDGVLARTHPEDVPSDATKWLEGRASTRERRAWWESLWRR